MKLAAFCAVIGLAVGYVQGDSPPQWDPVYSVKGVLNVPYAELHKPFFAWFDSKNGESRIDYYGSGEVKTYQLTGSVYPPFGTSVKIATVPTETEMNKETCLHVNGTSDNLQEIQSVLPDMTDFKYNGTESMQDSDTSKWQMIQNIGDKINKYTMWVKYRKSLHGESVAIPVRYEVKGFNSQLDSHYDHYYLDYSDYNVDEIHADVFKVNTVQCGSFSGPSKQHLATLNPMKVFVHPVHESHVDMEFTSFIHSKNLAHLGFSTSVNHLADRTEDELAALSSRLFTAPQDRIKRTSGTGSDSVNSEIRRCSASGGGSCSGTCTVMGPGTCSGSCTAFGIGSCGGSCTSIGSGICSGSCTSIGSGSCSGSCTVIGGSSCSGTRLVIAGYTVFGSG